MTLLIVTFWVSACAVVYTFAGYPLLLALLARCARPTAAAREAADVSGWPDVTVIVVAHHESARIARRIENLFDADYPGTLRVIVASDGSGDGTAEHARAYASRGVTVLDFAERRGKAACINDAVAAASTEILVFADVRQRLAPRAIRRLVQALQDTSFGAVSGELEFEDDAPTDFSRGVDLYWRYEKFIRAREARLDSAVGVTGAIYALRRSCFTPIPGGLILDDVFVPMRVTRYGKRVGFDPGAIAYDVPSRDAAAERHRKVRTLAGNWQLVAAEPWLLSPLANRLWWQFVSHKVLRLVAPLFLLTTLVTSAVLAGGSRLFLALFCGQIAFYGAPALAALLPDVPARSLMRAPLAFVQLNWFAVSAFWEFLRGRERRLWN